MSENISEISGKRFPEDFDRIERVKSNDKLLINDSKDGIDKYATPNQILSGIVKDITDIVTDELKSRIVGKKSSGGGEIFNDYANNQAGEKAHAEGTETTADGYSSHAEGNGTESSGISSHAEGNLTKAKGNFSHTEGNNTQTLGIGSHAEGYSFTSPPGDAGTVDALEDAWDSYDGQSEDGHRFSVAGGDYSHIEGEQNFTAAPYSHAEGRQNIVRAPHSHAEGYANDIKESAIFGAHAEGQQNIVSAQAAHAEGKGNQIEEGAVYAHAEGSNNTAAGEMCHIEGSGNVASGKISHAEGENTKATNQATHAEGSGSEASAYGAHAEGLNTKASGDYAHSEGSETEAIGPNSHTEGITTKATSQAAHAEGGGTVASGYGSHAEGNLSKTSGIGAHAEGDSTQANADNAHAEGQESVASGQSSHAEGYECTASGDYGSHAEGQGTTASGQAAHAEGIGTQATDSNAHAEGQESVASGQSSHAEGYECTASGDYGSHAEGQGTAASGQAAHAEGIGTQATGSNSHASGLNSVASGETAHAMGADIYAESCREVVIGQYNEKDSNPSPQYYNTTKKAFSIGNGTSDAARSDAFKILGNGTVYADNTTMQPMADYAEMFEWLDGNPSEEDRVGYMVALAGDKIIKASGLDGEVLIGVISGAPSILGDAPMRWNKKYINDKWGRPIYETITYTETEPQLVLGEDGQPVTDENGVSQMQEVEVTKQMTVRKLNPAYNPEEEYIPREQRPEWAAVGLLGKLLVRQDGTLVAGGFCKPNSEGIATTADSGYYVLEVKNGTQARVLVK